MKNNTLYMLLIVFIVFLFFKKIIDLIVDIEFPTYKPPPTGNWKYLVTLRDICSFISLVVIVAILIISKGSINFYINLFLYTYLLYDILYFLIDYGIIYYFIDKTNKSKQYIFIIETFDKYLNSFINVILSLFCFYSFVFIFFNK